MAYSYVWPPTLPQRPKENYSEDHGVLMLSTPMDAGPAKQRKRGTRPDTMQLEFLMTEAQVLTLETFAKTTISGTARFGFPHPRTRETVEARIIPESGGKLYSLAYVGPGYWHVGLRLEVLP